jgi:hypothetical protein
MFIIASTHREGRIRYPTFAKPTSLAVIFEKPFKPRPHQDAKRTLEGANLSRCRPEGLPRFLSFETVEESGRL